MDKISGLARSLPLLVFARLATIFVTLVVLPAGGWVLGRGILLLDKTYDKVVELQQTQRLVLLQVESLNKIAQDHETRLRQVEKQNNGSRY